MAIAIAPAVVVVDFFSSRMFLGLSAPPVRPGLPLPAYRFGPRTRQGHEEPASEGVPPLDHITEHTSPVPSNAKVGVTYLSASCFVVPPKALVLCFATLLVVQ